MTLTQNEIDFLKIAVQGAIANNERLVSLDPSVILTLLDTIEELQHLLDEAKDDAQDLKTQIGDLESEVNDRDLQLQLRESEIEDLEDELRVVTEGGI